MEGYGIWCQAGSPKHKHLLFIQNYIHWSIFHCYLCFLLSLAENMVSSFAPVTAAPDSPQTAKALCL